MFSVLLDISSAHCWCFFSFRVARRGARLAADTAAPQRHIRAKKIRGATKHVALSREYPEFRAAVGGHRPQDLTTGHAPAWRGRQERTLSVSFFESLVGVLVVGVIE